MSLCQCGQKPVPAQWRVKFQGVANGSFCMQCGDLNTANGFDLSLTPLSCTWWAGSASACGAYTLDLRIVTNGSQKDLELTVSGNGDSALFRASNVQDYTKEYPLSRVSSSGFNCDFTSASVTATPVVPARSDFSATDSQCIVAMLQGSPPGNCDKTVPAPYLGDPIAACPSPEGSGCGCSAPTGSPSAFPVPNECGPSGGCATGGCGCGSNSDPLDPPKRQVAEAKKKSEVDCPHGSPRVSVSNGNLVTQVAPLRAARWIRP